MDKPVKVWTLDTETRGLFGGIFRIGLYDGDNYYCADTFDELYPVLANSDLFNDNHVYIHNLDFDVAKLAPNIFNKETIDFKKSLFINGSIKCILTIISLKEDGRYTIKTETMTKKKVRVNFSNL